MSAFDLTAVFLALMGLAGWLNVRVFKLPTASMMVLTGLAGAGLLLLMQWAGAPEAAADLARRIETLSFPTTVLGYMLAFLLFAGAMQVDLSELRRRILAVTTLATFGVAASTAIVGGLLWLAAGALGLPLSLAWAFVFGALISPTDPIAVVAAVRGGNLAKGLEAVLQGEALLNDGVGIVVFLAATQFAAGAHGLDPAGIVAKVAVQAIGGMALGAAAAAVVMLAMRAIDAWTVEVSLSVALAMGVYSLATALDLSGPLAVVVAGFMVGGSSGSSESTVMSEETRRHLRAFWTFIDETLSALLFLMLGLESLVIHVDPRLAGLWAIAILLALATRLVVVLPWAAYFRFRHQEYGAGALMTWGGLHGALSLALALSLPPGGARQLVISTTFAVVIFSVLVQGITFAPLAEYLAKRGRRRL